MADKLEKIETSPSDALFDEKEKALQERLERIHQMEQEILQKEKTIKEKEKAKPTYF